MGKKNSKSFEGRADRGKCRYSRKFYEVAWKREKEIREIKGTKELGSIEKGC